MKMLTLFYIFQRYAKWKCWLFVLFFSEVCRMKMLTVCFIFFRGIQNKNVDCFIFFRGMQNANVDLFFQRFAEWKCWLFILFFSEICRMKMLTVCFIFFRGMQNENVDCLFYFFQRYAEWKCWLCFIFFRGMQNENVDFVLYFSEVCRMKMLTVCFIFFRGMQNTNVDCFIFFRGMQNENVDCSFYFFQRYAEWKCWLFALLCLPPLLWGDILFLSCPSVHHTVCQHNSSATTEQNFMKLGR